MDFATILTIALNIVISSAITNIGTHDESSIPKDFKRHIGLTPDSNWEPGLREATHQALLKEHVPLNHLRERILQAPMTGQGAKVSPFGDVAILARGQLFANDNGYRFVQEPNPNDCIDCHELRKCNEKECDIYLHNDLGERLIALWTVKRLRHRNPDVRYELEYSISPIRKHVWVTRNGGYDYSIPGHVFVVKTVQGHGYVANMGGYFNDGPYEMHLDKLPALPHYPHPPVPAKVHSNKHPFTPNKPSNMEQWIEVDQPPLIAPPASDNKIPNYYLPQKPVDQAALTSEKDLHPTLDYAVIEAYKHLLQVLHDRTSTTAQKTKPSIAVTKKPTTPIHEASSLTATLPTRPPLSHTTWFLPTTIKIMPLSTAQTNSTSPKSSEMTKTTKEIETARTSFMKPMSTTFETTKPLYSTSQSKSRSSFRPTIPKLTLPTLIYSTKPQVIYQHLGGFDTTKTFSTSISHPMATIIRKPMSKKPSAFPMKTTIPMTHVPTQPSYTSASTAQETTNQKETTQPMTIFSTIGIPKPTRPMTSQRPHSTLEPSSPLDGQTTSTFLFGTRITPPFGLHVTRPVGYPLTQNHNTIATIYGKPSHGTTFMMYPPKADYDKTTLPVKYPTGSTIPESTYHSSQFGGDSTIPVSGNTDQDAITSIRTTEGTTIYRGTETSTTYGSTIGITQTKYPTTQYLPSTTSGFTKPKTIYTDGTRSTTFHDLKTNPVTISQDLPTSPTRPTGLLKTTTDILPTPTGYQRPIPTFFIDATHPGYPKTTPTTPFTDGQSFKPSHSDPAYNPIPPLSKPSTVSISPTYPTTDFTSSHEIAITTLPASTGHTATTLLMQPSPNRYTPPATTHNHTITIPTKSPKPNTSFKVPDFNDYDVDLFPPHPKVRTTTSTTTPPLIPPGDFILHEEDYKPRPVIAELNPAEVDVFEKLPPVTSTKGSSTTTVNSEEIKEVFDSATYKPKPAVNENIFDNIFKQTPPTTTISGIKATRAKVIYSDFFEASTLPPSRVLDVFTTIPSTSQSYSTSVSFKVNTKNQNGHANSGNTKPPKENHVKTLQFRKAKVKELSFPAGDYKVYRAVNPEVPEPHTIQNKQQSDNHLVDDIEIIHTGNNTFTPRPKYGPKGRKYKTKLKPAATASTPATKVFDDLALQLVNHARTIDYLEGKPTETNAVVEKATSKTQRTESNTNPQNRNHYKRKGYGRVRKVKKRTENRATITRSNRDAVKALNTFNTTQIRSNNMKAQEKNKLMPTPKPVERITKINKEK